MAAVNGAVNALATPAYDRARDHARRLMKLPPAERGLLAGLPVRCAAVGGLTCLQFLKLQAQVWLTADDDRSRPREGCS